MPHVISSILLALAALTGAEENCLTKTTKLICDMLKLESDKPFDLNLITFKLDNTTTFKIYNAEGSIGKKTFSNLSQMKDMYIADSKISNIEDGALCSPKFETIELHSNKEFPVLTQSILSNCDKLTKLRVQSTEMQPDALKNLVGLEKLSLMSQTIPHLTNTYLGSLANLKLLQIIDCTIGKIEPEAVCISSKLEYLIIGGKEPMPKITKSTFQNCQNVKNLRINFNNNQSMEENLFSAFTSVKEAKIWRINVGHLKKTHLTGLSNVEDLQMAKCHIHMIDPDTFSNFSNLRVLSFRDNEMTEFDSSVIAPLKNLQYLDLQRNKLTTIYNIRHPNLKVLYRLFNQLNEGTINGTALKENLPKLEALM